MTTSTGPHRRFFLKAVISMARTVSASFPEGVGGGWSALGLDVEIVSEAGEERVIGVVRADGTRRGGGPSAYGAAHVFTVRNGRIVRFREYTDLDAPLG